MADESRTLYKGPYATGDTLFNIVEERRKQESKKDLLSFESDIKTKEMGKANEFSQILENLKHQNTLQESQVSFDRAKASEMLTNQALSAHVQTTIQNMLGQGIDVPGMTEPTPPERAEHVPTSSVPSAIPPRAAPTAEKNLTQFMGAYNTQQQAILRDKLGWINDEHITQGQSLADELEKAGDPMSLMTAQTLRATSVEGTPKSSYFHALQGANLARMNNTARLDQLKARLESATALQTQLHTLDNETKLAIAKLKTEGTLAQVNSASRALMALNGSHQAFTAELRELGAELGREYRPEVKKLRMEEMAAKRKDQEAIASQIRVYASAIDDVKSRSAPTPSTLSQRRQFEQDLRAAGVQKTIDWTKFGDDSIAVNSTLTPEEQKKVFEIRQKRGGK